MTNYKLFKYGLGVGEELVFESENLGNVISAGITLSDEKQDVCGYYTYRLETWIDYERQYGFRYFNNGREITSDIRKAILGSIVSDT